MMSFYSFIISEKSTWLEPCRRALAGERCGWAPAGRAVRRGEVQGDSELKQQHRCNLSMPPPDEQHRGQKHIQRGCMPALLRRLCRRVACMDPSMRLHVRARARDDVAQTEISASVETCAQPVIAVAQIS